MVAPTGDAGEMRRGCGGECGGKNVQFFAVKVQNISFHLEGRYCILYIDYCKLAGNLHPNRMLCTDRGANVPPMRRSLDSGHSPCARDDAGESEMTRGRVS